MPVSFDHAQRIPEFLEAAARVRDPNLVAYWQIIMTIQVNLVNPTTGIVRPFAEFTRRRTYAPAYHHFAESAYQWLVFLHRAGLTAEGLAKIGPTKPGLVEKLRRTLASHEITHARKKTRENHPAGQAYKRIFMTEADFMVGEGVMEVLGHPPGPVLNSEIADIPTSESDKVRYVDEMVAALKNMVGRDEGMKAQVNQVMATSASVFESLAWRLFIACRQAQIGKPKVSPWATSYYYRTYDNFQSRWEDLIHFVNTNKAAVSNLFLSSYFVRFAADPYKELSTKNQNAKTNNDKADKKRAGDEAIATLAGNPLPPNTATTGGNAQPQVNAENAEQAAQGFVAAAGAASAEARGPQEPQVPIFARPQDINMASDGWINYQDNDFEALYRMHEAQLDAYNAEVEAYNKQKNAAANGDSSDIENDSENDDDDSAHEDDNGEAPDEPNYGADYNDIFDDIYGVSDDETRERRRQNVLVARAPVAPPNMNGRGPGPTMAGPPMSVLTTRLPPAQAGPTPQPHAFGGLGQPPAPRTGNQQAAPRSLAAPRIPQNSPQEHFRSPARMADLPAAVIPTLQLLRPASPRSGPHPGRPAPNQIQTSAFSHGSQTVQSQALPLANLVPRPVITPASERARLLRESQQAVSAARPVTPAPVLGFSPTVLPSGPLEQVAPSQAAPQPPQLQPAHDWFDSPAGPAP